MKSLKTLGAVALLSTSMLGAATSFAAVEGTRDQQETPVHTKFKVSDDGTSNEKPENPNPDEKPDNPDGNKPLNPAGPFGIAYIPASFTTKNFDDGEVLKESGAQEFDFKNTNMHVGVKDKTHTKGGWTLKAKLDWTKGKLDGASIKATTDGAKINENKSGSAPQYLATTDVTAGNSLTINNEDSDIMIGHNLDNKVYNNTFDVHLGNAKLSIPEVGQVEAGEYTGTVTWTLTATSVF